MSYFENNLLECPVCSFDHNHLVGTLVFSDDDSYRTQKVTIDGKHEIMINARYDFRSQGNIHLLFICESGHYHSMSFDGHKGGMFMNENPLMDKLVLFLNTTFGNADDDYENRAWGVDRILLRRIESFFEKEKKEEPSREEFMKNIDLPF